MKEQLTGSETLLLLGVHRERDESGNKRAQDRRESTFVHTEGKVKKATDADVKRNKTSSIAYQKIDCKSDQSPAALGAEISAGRLADSADQHD